MCRCDALVIFGARAREAGFQPFYILFNDFFNRKSEEVSLLFFYFIFFPHTLYRISDTFKSYKTQNFLKPDLPDPGHIF